MVALLGLLLPLVLALTAAAAPAPPPPARTTTKYLKTAIGSAAGVGDGAATRYVVRYGSAQRWAPPAVATTWALPNNLTDPSGSPLACAQDYLDPSAYSEDCLSLILYVPNTVTATTKASTILWIHGGSFMYGSATDPGLDGSNLAVATKSIVAVVQYRLGGFGWVGPNGQQNLGALDIIASMTFLNNVLPTFGGVANKITLAGQSSGATIIRALLAAPSVTQLFQSAILQSDPMDYGFYTPAIQTKITNDFVSYLNCASTDAKCLASLSTEDILGAADNVAYDIAYGFVDPAAGGGEQFRPVRDGTFITSPLDSTAAFLKQTKPLLITTVNKEAASTIYNGYTVPTTINNYTDAVDATYPTSSKQILSSSYYGVPASMQTQSNPDTRPQLEVLGTDGIWRCPSWTFARSWANAGGRAYVGEFAVGASYPGSGNSDLAACMQPGAVCHQDDIQIVFGTVNNPSAAQTKAITDVQARIAAFVKNGSPNTSPYPNWSPASSTNANAVQLGGNDSSVTVGGCTPNFWGDAVPYDYQVYGL